MLHDFVWIIAVAFGGMTMHASHEAAPCTFIGVWFLGEETVGVVWTLLSCSLLRSSSLSQQNQKNKDGFMYKVRND